MSNYFREIQSEGKVQLRCQIKESKGFSVNFSNGCWLDLRSEDGHLSRTNSYGENWFCNADDR
ncbi:hypothetical protein C0068_11145 [Zhongshania marina]|uniref:Uncharacterized protein n=1 Tax=Zhongshania marina TaxID=2304603 RepID=A0A2S4HF64_9GAMM|nr:hypothetical protein C0068_11145 [Marortus luteolus]